MPIERHPSAFWERACPLLYADLSCQIRLLGSSKNMELALTGHRLTVHEAMRSRLFTVMLSCRSCTAAPLCVSSGIQFFGKLMY